MNRSLILVAGWVGQAFATALATLKRPLASEIAALRERLEKLRAQNDLLRARLERIEPHRRPFYSPWERLGILLHRARYGMSFEATARPFVVTVQTLINWTKEVESGVARVVRSLKPLNALPDLVREISAFLRREWPRWGTRRIAGILARLGLEASRSSVQRLLRRPPLPRRRGLASRAARPIIARHPGHVFVIDFTRVRLGFFRTVVVGAVLDLFSRKIVALGVVAQEPDAAFACRLLSRALRHRKPRWVVSDHGVQFVSRRFTRLLARHKIRRRWGAVGKPGAQALDRWFRTLKDEFARGLLPFRSLASIACDLSRYVTWYNGERPHGGLGYRTPDEVFGDRPLRPIRRFDPGVLEVQLLHGDRRLPVFRIRPAA